MAEELKTEHAVDIPGRGHDHASLALLPFGVTSEEHRFEPVTIAYQTEVDGKLRRVNVTLSPGAEAGMPFPSDQTVFLALLQLATRAPAYQNRLEFRLQELLGVLEWSDGGKNFDRLRAALDRLAQVTIRINTALVARGGGEYNRTAEAAHILDAYHIRTRHSGPCWVEWGVIVREAFRLGDIKRIDWELVKALSSSTAAQLYRLLDRVVLAGEQIWEIGWKPLGLAIGMSTKYPRPAQFLRRLQPSIDSLIEHGVLDGFEYGRGGKFVFHMRNYTRARLREVLESMGVFPEAARKAVASVDEAEVMVQCDCQRFGTRPPDATPGYLVQAVREAYELRYPPEEPEAFAALWALYSAGEREAYHRAGLWLCDLRDDLFATRPDPTAWPPRLRAVVRFMCVWNLDPELVLTPTAARKVA
jgi:hypothetical protein